jgi:hypothetical protein
MATISLKEFSQGKPITTVGNESSNDFKKQALAPKTIDSLQQTPEQLPSVPGQNYIQGYRDITSKLSEGQTNTFNALKTRGEDIFNRVTSAGAEAQKTGATVPERLLGAVSTGAKEAIGGIAGGVGDILTNMVSPFVPQSVKDTGSDITNELKTKWNTKPDATKDPQGAETYDKLHGLLSSLSEVSKNNPQTSKIIKDAIAQAFDIASLSTGGEGEAGVKTTIDTLKPTVKQLSDVVSKESGAIVSDVGQLTKQKAGSISKPLVEGAGKLKEKVFPTEVKTPESITGQIVQGETKDIPRATKVLSEIPSQGINKYSDLKSTLDSKVSSMVNKLDTKLSQSPIHNNPTQLKDWYKMDKVDGKIITHNYVEDALNQLKDYYTKTNDAVNAEKIAQTIQKANNEGLTIRDVNNIARLHGQELNAFNASGEIASGLSKQALENTRSGLKSTARDAYGNKEFELLDEKISDTIKTRDLINDQVEAVNKLQQKIKTRTVGEKLGRLIGEVVNVVGMNSPKGFLEYFLGRGTGLKTLNALDLEGALNSNIKTLRELFQKEVPEETMIKKLEALISNNQGLSNQALPEGKSSMNLTNKVPPQKNSTINSNTSITKNGKSFQPKSQIGKMFQEASKGGTQGGKITITVPKFVRQRMMSEDIKYIGDNIDRLKKGETLAGKNDVRWEDFLKKAKIDGTKPISTQITELTKILNGNTDIPNFLQKY